MSGPNVGDIPIYIGPEWGTTPSSGIGGVSPQTFNRFEYWGGQTNGATTLEGFLNCYLTGSSTANQPQPTSASLLKSTKRSIFTSTAAATMGIFDGTGLMTVWRGNAAGLGGFSLRLKFGFEATSSGALHNMFAGLVSQSGSGAAFNPTTQTTLATLGVGFSQTPAPNFAGNYKIISSVGDGSTAPTVTDLGAAVPVDITSLYQLDLVAAPDAASVAYTLTNLSTGGSATGTVSTNFPASTKFLAMWCACAIGSGGSTQAQFDVAEYCYQQNQ